MESWPKPFEKIGEKIWNHQFFMIKSIFRRKSDLNSARLEASISLLSKEVTKFSGSSAATSVATSVVSSNQSSPRKYRAPPRPESPKVPPRPKGLREKTKALDQRRSWSPRATSPSPSSSPKKKIITPLSPSVAKSRRSMDSHAIRWF